ncbi:longevity assurance proteins LAG1/LAC1 [Lentinus tigrinus ALCF2SS1-7]|uniref:Longevity assurance proteins LAG1/LAC1 n=1 Tax=Lentinus tigrinus ALCF2SS1-6 TaxID=1328759 RepID=A0A5C2SS58_9APHY|nr:longevity assurance proteins LAG1/LAC1 [Lentinus tigrinus ALCF2SS1-6]RPD80667.1 longevity assurance proteins LAG1/LAC1 [Lentinus tigrinus ALCF2SS1-7]
MNTAQAPAWLPAQLVPFFTLSYPTAPPQHPDSFTESNYYATGLLDGFIIVTAIAIMAILRDVTRVFLMEPFARWRLRRDLQNQKRKKLALANGNGSAKTNGNGVAKTNGYANGNGYARREVSPVTPAEQRKLNRSVTRFAEQSWSVIYYTAQFCFGLYVHSRLPTDVLNPIKVWTHYPHIPIAGPVKFYYLLQTAFYIHQILILNAEARRTDHWQMMAHHFITVALMISSYFYNYTRIGCLIMVLMDACDIFLPLAKMFRYLGMSMLCDVTFVVFLLSWLVTRHFLFILAIKATWESKYAVPRVWDPSRGHFMTKEIYIAFLAMLIALQIIQLVWFWMICRVAYRVVTGQGAEDSRSDDEE